MVDYFANFENFYPETNTKDIVTEEEKVEEDEEQLCILCESTNLIFDYEYNVLVCNECGATCVMNTTFETRSFGDDTNPRYGQPTNALLPQSSLATTIASNYKYRSLNRLQKWNQMPATERSLYDTFKKIDEMVKNSILQTDIVTEAKTYYKKLTEKDSTITGFLTRGNIRISLIAACIFIACKNNNKPMREIEIANLCRITKSDITKGLKKFNKLEKNKNISINVHKDDIHDYVKKYCNKLNISDKLERIIHLICVRSNKIQMIRNSNNCSICAGLFYFISEQFNLDIKKQTLMRIINVSEVTLNKIYKIFLENKKILFLGFNKIDSVDFKN